MRILITDRHMLGGEDLEKSAAGDDIELEFFGSPDNRTQIWPPPWLKLPQYHYLLI